MIRRGRRHGVDILTYHSIATGPGPLAIRPETFQIQMETIAQCGFRGVSLRDYFGMRDEPRERAPVVVLTFDDGYQDFAEVAFPEIKARGWSCTVFLCSGLVGTPEGWDPDGAGPRPLLDWGEAATLAAQGVELGGHSVSHPDLTRLTGEHARAEIATAKETIEARARCEVTCFAAPYGRTTAAIRADIARFYCAAVGTRMDRADADSDRFDLPRIDMWYFRNPTRWRQYLEGAAAYFTLRRALRLGRLAVGRAAGLR